MSFEYRYILRISAIGQGKVVENTGSRNVLEKKFPRQSFFSQGTVINKSFTVCLKQKCF